MVSFEEQFYLENPTRLQALWRDVKLLWWLAVRALMWMSKGVLVRRAYLKAQVSGEPLLLEDQFPD